MAFDDESVRAAWDRAADGYARGQRDGLDFYRFEFFGPAQLAVVGDVRGLSVLDVGCGAGYLTRLVAGAGATATGIDISPRMIELARAEDAGSTYEELDAVALGERFAAGSFDLAASCLALQDMPDPPAVLRAVRAVLRPGGRFVASIEHPCSNPPVRFWERDERGAKQHLCIDRYFDRGPRQYEWERWPTQFTTTARHAPLADWFAWLLAAGFSLRGFHEPVPSPEAIARRPKLADALRVPYFAMFDV
ncbi:MAG: class I SAM-dependent methyltransferase, partial [Acidobacteriota bacterium]